VATAAAQFGERDPEVWWGEAPDESARADARPTDFFTRADETRNLPIKTSFLASPPGSFYRAAMRPLRALVIYIAVVFVGGALLAPWFYWLVQTVAQTFPKIANAPFHRYVHRAFLGLALAGLWPLLKALGARSTTDLGLVHPAGQWRKLGAGFGTGFLSLAIVAGIALAAGARTWPANLMTGILAGKLLGALATAAAVGVLEEILFRGGIFAGLRRLFDWRFALVISSAIYALVHFFAPAKHEGAVTWTSGLALLLPMLGGFTDWQQLIPGFFNLTLAGALLALAFQRTGNLYFSIGLHAGWIFWLRSYGALTTQVTGANLWLYGSGRMIDGWLAFVVLSLTLAALPRRPAASDKTSAA
jgi:membrane protease YdiL (CAAX protease family)